MRRVTRCCVLLLHATWVLCLVAPIGDMNTSLVRLSISASGYGGCSHCGTRCSVARRLYSSSPANSSSFASSYGSFGNREWYGGTTKSKSYQDSQGNRTKSTSVQSRNQRKYEGEHQQIGNDNDKQGQTNNKGQQTGTLQMRMHQQEDSKVNPTKAVDKLIANVKRDFDANNPITLNRLEIILKHPYIAPNQVYQILDIGRAAGLTGGLLYSLVLNTLSKLPPATQPSGFVERVNALMRQDDIVPSTKDYTSNIRVLCKAGKLDKAQDLVKEMESQGLSLSTTIYNTLFNYRAKMGHLDKCMELYRSMKLQGVAPNTWTLVILMEGFCAFGGLHYAIKMFEKFKEDGYTPSTSLCNVLLRQIAELGTLSQLEFLFSQMKQSEAIQPDLESYSYLYAAFKKANRQDKMDELQTLLAQDENVPDIDEIGSRLMDLGKTGYLDKALNMLETLRRLEIPLTTACYNGVIFAFTHELNFAKRAEAIEVYNEMIANGTPRDLDTYVAIMSIFFKNKDWKNVIEAYRNIRGYQETVETKVELPTTVYSMLLASYLELGRYKEAREVITRLEETNTQLDESVYESFISTLGRGMGDGAVEEVLRMVEHMKKKGLEPGTATYVQLFNNLINVRQQDKAFELLMTMSSEPKQLPGDLFSPLIKVYCSNEDTTKALELVRVMKKLQVLPNEVQVTALVFCLVRQRLFEQAWDVTAWASGSGLDSHAYEGIIRSAEKKN